MQENVDLQAFNTFGLPAKARWYCAVDSLDVLQEALQHAREHELPVFVLGGGSNVLLQGDVPGLTLHMGLKGIRMVSATDDEVLVEAACGENWHEFVSHCLAQGWYGLENLALIPGSVGAAPIQNIGAYGVEVAQHIESVRVLEPSASEESTLAAAACGFGYRDSVFKQTYKRRSIVLSVVFRLWRKPRVNLSYAALAQALADNPAPLPRDVFTAVCAIRRSKLPDPTVLGNAGSFFKNPVVSAAQYAELQKRFADVPGHRVAQAAGAEMKIPAAWLIEQAGWKGRRQGDAGVFDKQPLVLVNHGSARAQDILSLAHAIMADVRSRYAIDLEPEVQWIPEP